MIWVDEIISRRSEYQSQQLQMRQSILAGGGTITTSQGGSTMINVGGSVISAGKGIYINGVKIA